MQNCVVSDSLELNVLKDGFEFWQDFLIMVWVVPPPSNSGNESL